MGAAISQGFKANSPMEGTISLFEIWMPSIKLAMISLAWAILVLIIGWVAAALVGRTVLRVASRSLHIDRTVLPMAYTATVWSIRILVFVAVLAHLGIQTASIITVLGAAGVAIGLALQGTLQNIAA